MALDEGCGDSKRKGGNLVEAVSGLQRHDDVEALRTGGLQPAAQAELVEQVSNRERCRAHYSFAAARAALFPLVERALAGSGR